jgi:hypothetical protein
MGNGHIGAKLDDPEMRRLRGLMMLEFKLRNNATNAQVGKEFNMSEKSVNQTFSWMRKAGLIAQAEDKVLQELVPLAHNALKAALTQTDDLELASQRAIDIFKGMLPAFSKKPTVTKDAPQGGDLSSYIDELRKGELSDSESADRAIEGEVVGALPAAASSHYPEGDADADDPVVATEDPAA